MTAAFRDLESRDSLYKGSIENNNQAKMNVSINRMKKAIIDAKNYQLVQSTICVEG